MTNQPYPLLWVSWSPEFYSLWQPVPNPRDSGLLTLKDFTGFLSAAWSDHITHILSKLKKSETVRETYKLQHIMASEHCHPGLYNLSGAQDSAIQVSFKMVTHLSMYYEIQSILVS